MKHYSISALYERQPGESTPAWHAFELYRDLGPDRSTRAVGQKLSKSRTLIGRWSKRWRWCKRVEAISAHEADLLEAARRKLVEAKIQQWAKREQQIREREWDHAEQLITKGQQMLKMPIVKQEKRETASEDGKTIERVTVIEPTKWDFGTASRMLELASKLGRMAVGMETDKVRQDIVVRAGPGTAEARVVLFLPDNGMRQAGATVTLPMEQPPGQAGGNGAAKAPQPKGRAGAAK